MELMELIELTELISSHDSPKGGRPIMFSNNASNQSFPPYKQPIFNRQYSKSIYPKNKRPSLRKSKKIY